jgi:hypothetical protein
MRGQLAALRIQIGPAVRDAYVIASRTVRRAVAVTARTSRRWTLIVLERLETVLLNASARERIHATATFALIFAFAVTSVDFMIAGGGEFGSPARAAQPRTILAAGNRTPPAPQPRVEQPMATELASTLADAREANVIAVSQNFGAPLMRTPPATASEEGLIEVSAQSAVSLAGQTDEEPVVQPEKAPETSGGKS